MSTGIAEANHEHARNLMMFLSACVMKAGSSSSQERVEAWVYVQHLADQLREHAKRSVAINALGGDP